MRRSPLFVVLALVSCGGSPAESNSATAMPDTGIADETSTAGTSEGSSTTTGDPGDPDYPRPDPVAAEGMCPADFFGPITFDGGAWICIPECDGESMCPPAATGTAEAACATNPLSSASPCEMTSDCTIEGEACGNVGGGQKGCLLAPSHCILRCDAEQVCPDEMTCTAVGVCGYSP